MKGKIVVGVAGMPGAGKAVVVEVGKKKDCGIVVMGDIVREETKRLKLELTPKNVGKVMLTLRREGGFAVIAKRCCPKIKRLRNAVVIVDGVRSLYEVDEFKKHFPRFKLLAIHSSPETRFKRLFNRKRSDDPASWEIFLEREWRELHVGLGSIIACADVMIVNEGGRMTLRRAAAKFLEDITESGERTLTRRSKN